MPLAGYAAPHWVDHAQFEGVSSRVRDGMDELFDLSWLQIHDMDEDWTHFSLGLNNPGGRSPLYHPAFCRFYDLVEHLIARRPEQLQAVSGRMLPGLVPLPTALHRKHFCVAADLLHQYGVAVAIRGNWEKTPPHTASMHGLTDIVQWLLNHKADGVNDQESDGSTPLHLAALNGQLEVVQVLLNHNLCGYHWNTGQILMHVVRDSQHR